MGIIEVNNVSVRFNLATEKVDSIKDYFIRLVKKQLMFKEFYALKDVSASINAGESVAFMGVNGSGKSTLLKTITGIYQPYRGNIVVRGKIAPLIELGAGFDTELTARENIYLNGALFGMNRDYMNERFTDIIDFAELQDFVDVPVKNFSSGMTARLGFSIATLVKPDILICDEILSVGDMRFQKKCEERMDEMMSGGTTLLFVSHSIEQVKKICKRVVLLNHGKVIMDGATEEVCDYYIKLLSQM